MQPIVIKTIRRRLCQAMTSMRLIADGRGSIADAAIAKRNAAFALAISKGFGLGLLPAVDRLSIAELWRAVVAAINDIDQRWPASADYAASGS